MSKPLFKLDEVAVASPCKASWAGMRGDDQARFCSECRRHVYNLSGMTRTDAEALVRDTEGRVCVRFFRRTDGMMLTRDCPVGVHNWRWRLVIGFVAGGVLLVMAAFMGLGWLAASNDEPGRNPLREVLHRVFPSLAPAPRLEVMGKICPPMEPAVPGVVANPEN